MAVSKKIFLLICGLFFFVLTAQVHAWGAETSFFFDTFEGSNLDSQLWQSEQSHARRWCGEEKSGFAPGNWVSIAVRPCYSTLQAPPYGKVSVGKGVLQISSDNEYIFPYFFTDPSSANRLFPATGDFSLEIRLRFDRIGWAGTGVYVRFWDQALPSGVNPPVSKDLRVFSIWSDCTSSRIGLLGETVILPEAPEGFKVYRLEYVGGKCSAFVDNRRVAGPITSMLRPNMLWVGNPLVLWWRVGTGESGWTAFTIDYVKVARFSAQAGTTAKK